MEEAGEEEGLEKRDGSATAVQWERFLPLRVLLVEADDSTRQIIAALLRKCSYKVSAVPDGLKAWQILKGKHHNIDIVLTEVELPSISGFALLTLVMEHDVCKSIPVIMMSSHDSISMVLKCMLKGAADLLIKPVRKNELRNLWQHVWRRHTLTGGHIPLNLTATQQKMEDGTDNKTTNNHSSDYVICSNGDKDSSEKGSDARDLSQPKGKNASNLSNSEVEKLEEGAKLPQESVIQLSETEENPSEFGIDVAKPLNVLRLGEDHDCAKATTQYESMGSESAGNGNITSEGSGNRGEVDEPLSAAIDFIGAFDSHPMCSHVHSGGSYGGSNKFECIPQLELSLRRFGPKDDKADERHTLSHFNASAISWCNSTKTLHSFFPTLPGACTEPEEGTDKIRQLLSSHYSENTVGISQKCVTLGKNEENTTSPIDDLSGKGEIAFPRPIPEVRCADFSSPKPAYQQEKPLSFQANTRTNNLYRRPDETFDDQIVSEGNSLEAMEEVRHEVSSATGQSCSSSFCNGIAIQLSCDFYGTRNDENEQANPPENSNDGVRGAGSLRSSEREAALAKFRLKRKDRCYEKKVRYQSRKRLAEQRPRVKGQFVRQVQTSIAGADG